MILEEKIGLTLSSRTTLRVTTGAKTDSNCHASIEYPDPYTNWLVFCDIFVIVRGQGTVLQPYTLLCWFSRIHETLQGRIEENSFISPLRTAVFLTTLVRCPMPAPAKTPPTALSWRGLADRVVGRVGLEPTTKGFRLVQVSLFPGLSHHPGHQIALMYRGCRALWGCLLAWLRTSYSLHLPTY